jgi:hypothetical protein
MSVGGKVVQVYDRGDLKWVNTLDAREYCAVYVDSEHDIQIDDKLWWQSGMCYWTRVDKDGKVVFEDKKIPKRSGSGVSHPLGKDYEVKYDFEPMYRQKKEQFENLKQRYEDNFRQSTL